MDQFWGLWLAIVVSAAVVWVAAFFIWTVLHLHKQDFQRLPDEAAFVSALRTLNIPPGYYQFPYWGDCKRGDLEAVKKWREGPVGMLAVWPPTGAMAGRMIGSFLVYLVISVFVAYLADVALPAGASFGEVFRVAGTAGILGYCFAFLPGAIWFNHPLRATVQGVIDGVIYGVLTGLVFALLWPGAGA